MTMERAYLENKTRRANAIMNRAEINRLNRELTSALIKIEILKAALDNK